MKITGKQILPGDLIAFSGKYPWSRWLHVALAVYIKPEWVRYFGYDPRCRVDGMFLVEGVASCLSSCAVTNKCTMGIQVHPCWEFFDAWSRGRAYVLSRPPKFWLTMEEQRELTYFVLRLLGGELFYCSETTPGDIIRLAMDTGRFNKPIRIK